MEFYNGDGVEKKQNDAPIRMLKSVSIRLDTIPALDGRRDKQNIDKTVSRSACVGMLTRDSITELLFTETVQIC